MAEHARRILKIGFFFTLLVAGGCQTAPVANLKPGERPNIETTEAGLWMQADRAEKKIQRSGNLVKHAGINRYVRSIVCRLSPDYCEQIRVYIVDKPGFNASMTPNGMMIVQSGLMLRAQNEAQLAFVLGHEMAHFIRRHTLQRWQTVKDTTGFLTIVSIALGASGLGGASPMVGLMATGGIFANSRDNEREADGLGLAMIVKAGYEPQEASKVWKHLLAERRAMEDADIGQSFFSTHPGSEERMETLSNLAKTIPGAEQAKNTNLTAFIEAVGPHRDHWLERELRLGKLDRTEVVINNLLQQSKDLGVLHFYKGELYRKRNTESDFEKAIEAYSKALTYPDSPPKTHRALGFIYRKRGETNKAHDSLNDYLKLQPRADDHAMIRHYLEQSK